MKFDLLDAARYLKIYDWCNKKMPDLNFLDSLSPSQVKSKMWLVEELSKIPELNSKPINVEIVGSWFGWPLTEMLCNTFEINNIQMYDLDKTACRVSYQYREIFEHDKNKIGITNINYWDCMNRKSNADLVINCSSEHMKETFYQYEIYHRQCIFAIQSNNLFDEITHINCCTDEDHVVKKHKFKSVIYKGSQKFNDLHYKNEIKRFMVIGKI